jgi:signal transduction histidine kinase
MMISRLKLQQSPIARKLTLMNMLVSGIALLLACTAFLAYDRITYRESLVNNLSSQAQIIGSNSVSAIVFNDPQSAQTTLSALRSSPNVLYAAILTPDGQLFSGYWKHPDRHEAVFLPNMQAAEVEAHSFVGNEVLLTRRVMFNDKAVGYVLIRGSLQELSRRTLQFIRIVIAILAISLLAALLVSSVFRNAVAKPIVALAETARIVSIDKNYSLRVTADGAGGELVVLINAFNEMLGQIQNRDQALRAAHDDLEKRVEERTTQLLAANKELEAFSYTVSHDLRGPIETISGVSFILSQDYSKNLDADGVELVGHLQSATQRMSELIDDLLKLSRVTRSEMEFTTVDLSSMAREIIDELQQASPDRKVNFVAMDRVLAKGDARLLRVVMQNLLGNAWKYTSGHPTARIEFGVKQQEGKSVYFVRDDGAGFDSNYTNQLFQPFHRLHSTSEFPGSGIGLATVQRIIHRHGGQVWAEGQIEKGATFYFSL